MSSNRKLYIIEQRVLENIDIVESFLKDKNCELAISTKSLKLNKELLRLFNKHRCPIYEIKPDNIDILQEYQYRIISYREFLKNKSIVIANNFESLEELKKEEHCHSLYLFFDFGDHGEGFSTDDVMTIVSHLKNISFEELVIMSNIGCLSDLIPSANYFKEFSLIKNLLKQSGVIVNRFSLGGSNSIPFIDQYKDHLKIELRVGEAILFGTYGNVGSKHLPLHTENIFFETHLVRKIDKYTGLYDFGYCQAERNNFIGKSYSILKQSANHSLIEINDGSEIKAIRIPLNYRGLSRLSEQRKTMIKLI